MADLVPNLQSLVNSDHFLAAIDLESIDDLLDFAGLLEDHLSRNYRCSERFGAYWIDAIRYWRHFGRRRMSG